MSPSDNSIDPSTGETTFFKTGQPVPAQVRLPSNGTGASRLPASGLWLGLAVVSLLTVAVVALLALAPLLVLRLASIW